MKKSLIILSSALILCLTACGGSNPTSSQASHSDTPSSITSNNEGVSSVNQTSDNTPSSTTPSSTTPSSTTPSSTTPSSTTPSSTTPSSTTPSSATPSSTTPSSTTPSSTTPSSTTPSSTTPSSNTPTSAVPDDEYLEVTPSEGYGYINSLDNKEFSDFKFLVTGVIIEITTISEKPTLVLSDAINEKYVTITVFNYTIETEDEVQPTLFVGDIVSVLGYGEKYYDTCELAGDKNHDNPVVKEAIHENYDIVIDPEMTHGTIILSNNKPESGEKVVVTVTPDVDYLLETVTVDKVKLELDENNEYSFICSGNNVVSATFTYNGIDAPVKVDLSVADVGIANSWKDEEVHFEFPTGDENLTIVASTEDKPTNTGKYYSADPGTWRLYGSEKASVTITCKKKILKINITYKSKSSGYLTYNGEKLVSETDYDINSEKCVIGTAPSGSSQISKIVVYYEK